MQLFLIAKLLYEGVIIMNKKYIVFFMIFILFSFCGYLYSDTNEAKNLYINGLEMFNKEEYDSALRIFKEAIKSDPDFVKAYRVLILYTPDMDINELNKELQIDEKIESEPNNPLWHFCKGTILEKENKNEEALKEHNKALELGLKDAVLYNAIGCIYCFDLNNEEGMNYYSKAIELEPDWMPPYHNIATVKFRKKDYKGCLDMLEFIVNKSVLFFGTGDLSRLNGAIVLSGEFKQGEKIVRNILKKYPDYHYKNTILNYLYTCEYYQGEIPEALESLKASEEGYYYIDYKELFLKTLLDKPQLFKEFVSLELKWAQLELQEYKYCEKLIMVYNEEEYKVSDDELSIITKKKEKIAKQFLAIVEKCKDIKIKPFLHYRTLEIINRYNIEDKDLSYFVKKYPDSEITPLCLYQLGEKNISQEKYNEAIKIFNEITEKYPKSIYMPEVLRRLADCYGERGLKQYQKAIDILYSICDKYPNNNEQNKNVLSQIGLIYNSHPFDWGNKQKAISKYREYVNKYCPEYLYPLKYLGNINFESLKDYKVAAEYYEKILTLKLDFEYEQREAYRKLFYIYYYYLKDYEKFQQVFDKYFSMEKQKDDYFKALAEKSNTIKKYIKYKDALSVYADVELAINENREDVNTKLECIKKLEVLLKAHFNDVIAEETLLRIGKLYEDINQGKYYKNAVDTYEQLIKTYPNSEMIPKAYLHLGRVYRNFNINRKLDAINCYVTVINKYADRKESVEAYKILAQIYSNRYDKEFFNIKNAIQYYNSILVSLLSTEEDKHRALYDFGSLYYDNWKISKIVDDLIQSASYFKKATEKYKYGFESNSGEDGLYGASGELFKVLYEKGEYKKAVDIFEELELIKKLDKVDSNRGGLRDAYMNVMECYKKIETKENKNMRLIRIYITKPAVENEEIP